MTSEEPAFQIAFVGTCPFRCILIAAVLTACE
jgi:hypothetical protein